MSKWILLTDMLHVQEMILHYQRVFYYCRLLAVICGGLSIILFIVLEIPSVIGDITGVSAKKMIKKFEESNAAAMRHTQKKVFETGKSLSWEMNKNADENKTAVLQEDTGGRTSVLDIAAEDVNITRVLDENAVEDINVTRVLNESTAEDVNATRVLDKKTGE